VQYVHIALCLLACEMYTIFCYFCFETLKPTQECILVIEKDLLRSVVNMVLTNFLN
jgi:hypothetical protein